MYFSVVFRTRQGRGLARFHFFLDDDLDLLLFLIENLMTPYFHLIVSQTHRVMTVGTNIYLQQLVKVMELLNDHDDVIKID